MPGVSIFPSANRKTICIQLKATGKSGKAVLLGASGESLKSFSLSAGRNELSLDDFSAGRYALRVEHGSEVALAQIDIP